MATKTRGGAGANRTLITLQEDWSGGSRQDKPRDQIAGDAAWLLTDCFPDANFTTGSGFPLRSRNGWVRTCTAMSATASSSARAVGFGEFTGSNAARILGIDEDGRLYKWTPGYAGASPDSDGASTLVGTAVVPWQNPINYRGSVYIPSQYSTGYTYDGTTLAAMSGSPPQAALGCVWKDHLVLANDGTNEERVWFSDAGDPTGWNVAASGQWLDCSGYIWGIQAFQGMLFAFQEGLTERIRGDIIPGVINSDIVREPLFPIGTQWTKTICVTENGILFANADGVWMTDGQQAYDITAQCGMSEYWRESLKPEPGQAGSPTAGVYKGWYVFAATVDAASFCCAINLKKKQFVRITNVIPNMMATTSTVWTYGPPRLLMAESAAARISDLGVMLDEVSAYTDVDGNATVIAPEVQTRFYRGSGRQPQRWRSLYLTGGGDVPAGTTTIKYSTTPHVAPATTLTAVHTLGGTRTRVNIGQQAAGMSFSITPAFAAASTSTTGFHLDMLEAELSPLYGRRR